MTINIDRHLVGEGYPFAAKQIFHDVGSSECGVSAQSSNSIDHTMAWQSRGGRSAQRPPYGARCALRTQMRGNMAIGRDTPERDFRHHFPDPLKKI